MADFHFSLVRSKKVIVLRRLTASIAAVNLILKRGGLQVATASRSPGGCSELRQNGEPTDASYNAVNAIGTPPNTSNSPRIHANRLTLKPAGESS
jgi:hypothetical protein